MTDTHTPADTHHVAYVAYANILRAWFVAYGVGGPALFLTQPAISLAIRQSGQARGIVSLFLVGVACQVFIALVNKWVNWYLCGYASATRARHPDVFRFLEWLGRQFWIDVLCDVGSIVSFGWGTAKVLLLFA